MAQLGSAPDWGSGGRRFKSCHPDRVNVIAPCKYHGEMSKTLRRLEMLDEKGYKILEVSSQHPRIVLPPFEFPLNNPWQSKGAKAHPFAPTEKELSSELLEAVLRCHYEDSPELFVPQNEYDKRVLCSYAFALPCVDPVTAGFVDGRHRTYSAWSRGMPAVLTSDLLLTYRYTGNEERLHQEIEWWTTEASAEALDLNERYVLDLHRLVVDSRKLW